MTRVPGIEDGLARGDGDIGIWSLREAFFPRLFCFGVLRHAARVEEVRKEQCLGSGSRSPRESSGVSWELY
jgi:hypothetical protein